MAIELILIECPSCGVTRYVHPATRKKYKHDACSNCKNYYTAQTRFGHILWFYINLNSKVYGPYLTLREAKSNKQDSKTHFELVSFNRNTKTAKTVRGSPLSFSQTEVLKHRMNRLNYM